MAKAIANDVGLAVSLGFHHITIRRRCCRSFDVYRLGRR